MRFLKILIGLFSLGLTLALMGAVAGYFWFNQQMAATNTYTEPVPFTVQSGDSAAAVAVRLEQQDIINDARLFRLQARLRDVEGAIKAGEFIIPANATIDQVLDTLVSGRAVEYRVTLPEGRTVKQIFAIIEADPVLIGDMPEELPPEGSLLPDTYLFPRGMTRQEMIEKMQRAQTQLMDELWETRAEDLPISTKEEAIILASVVEKETGLASERPQIAGLFTTRLRRGMRLQSDPTVIYGVSRGEPLYNRRGQRRTLYRSELDRPTPWNTYQIDGLPETPICNPGRDAIAAVLNPPETEYIFFVADGTGAHLFAETLAEHNRNVAAYRAYEAQEIARERNQNNGN